MATVQEHQEKIDGLQAEIHVWNRRLEELRESGERKQHREELVEKIAANRKLIDAHRDEIDRHQAAATLANGPRLIGWDKTNISPSNVFGALGPETKVTTHYAASGRAETLAEGIQLTRSFDSFHRSKGWGGLSYHYLIPDTGEIILGRSTLHMGAHVLNTNTGNIGINFFCTTGHQPTRAQAQAFVWLLANAHTSKFPARHRTDRDLRNADIRGHKFWPGQATECPGFFTPGNLRAKARS